MNVSEAKQELSVRGKNGIAFLLSATVIWTLITVIFLLQIGLYGKNMFMLLSTALMFPCALLISKLIQADWKLDGNPLGNLGLVLNLAQFMYFPLVFWAFIQSPHHMVMVFAVITGAHFFPYGWFYNASAYYIMAGVISVAITTIGWSIDAAYLWMIPVAMVVLLTILILWLFMDFRDKNNAK